MNDSGLTEQFSLRWNNFHSNLSTEFHTLLQEEDLVDVTIAADGKFVQAHKVVLSVCSPYFKKLFKTNPCKHPIVILQDVTYTALGGLLQFMYCGEVSVCQEELPEFLKTAEMLQVKGLTGSDTQEQNKTLNKRPLTPDTKRKSKVPKRVAVEEKEECDGESVRSRVGSESPVSYVNSPSLPIDFSEHDKRSAAGEFYDSEDMEEQKPSVSAIAALLQSNATGENSVGASLQLHQQTNSGPKTTPSPSFPSSADQGFDGTQVLPLSKMLSVCPFCYKEFSTKSNLKIHMRDRHSGQGPWQCSLCSKLVKNKSSLRVHFYQQHRKPKTDIASIPDLKPI